MNRYFFLVLLFITATAFIKSHRVNNEVFERLYRLEGKWIMKTKKGAIGEEWIKVNKDYMQNRGYMIRGSDTIVTERVALTNTVTGIFYTSTVTDQNNQKPVAFRLTSSENDTFVFENEHHDFPKRISYQLINKDSLNAWIDDGKPVPEKTSRFSYSRQVIY